jgi:hypothetical protein
MKTQPGEPAGSSNLLTPAKLEKLKSKGFKYVQVKGMSSDNRLDYVDPRYLVLYPIKELPTSQSEQDIYEPIDSKLLMDWALAPDQGVKVVVAG